MKLYSTLSRKIEELQPIEPNKVKIYVCGVTVYDYSHIGHARTIVIFDVLRRFLVHRGFEVRFVQNFTDVDDKIIRKAAELGTSPDGVSSRFIQQYFQDFDRLNILRADVHPKATEHIQEMLALITSLLERGVAYVTSTGVYFDVSKFPEYGKLSAKPIDELKAGARIEVDPTKRNPLDFALWKFYQDGPLWESPWGRGRPGWHIECSAMSSKYLGESFDIHGGGQDLIFPHHENEIAQSEAATGNPLAKTWIHVGLVNIAQEKMSKSLGNIIPIHEANEKWGPNVLRLYCISNHYRSPVNFSEEAVKNWIENWRLIDNALAELQSVVSEKEDPEAGENLVMAVEAEFRQLEAALEDDFHTPVSLGAFMRMVRAVNREAARGGLSRSIAGRLRPFLERALWIYGLRTIPVSEEERARLDELLSERRTLRTQKRFKEADRIRDELGTLGFEITDHPDRTVWRKVR